jgi:glycosyltransferase involved in cell wall biosynthesis
MNNEVLVVIGSLNRGGAEIHLSQVLPELKKNDVNVKVYLLSDLGELAEPLQAQGVPIIRPWICRKFLNTPLRFLKILINSFQLFLYQLFKRPSIIHFFLPQTYLIGGVLSLLTFLPVRLMSRRSMNYYLEKYPPVIRKLEYWLHTKMTYILGNSKKVVEQLEHEEGVPQQKVRLIYNGIRLKESQEINLKKELSVPQNSILLVKCANLIPYKGHTDLIEALSYLDQKQRWDMVLVGNDSAHIAEDLKKQAQELGIGERVHFLGKRSDVVDILHSCDIGVLASHEEGFSNAILEGMAVGLPMVVTDVGGNAEAVIHKKSGLVVPSRSPKDMAIALQCLLDEKSLRVIYGNAAQTRFEENFQLENCVQAYYDLYRSILNKTN